MKSSCTFRLCLVLLVVVTMLIGITGQALAWGPVTHQKIVEDAIPSCSGEILNGGAIAPDWCLAYAMAYPDSAGEIASHQGEFHSQHFLDAMSELAKTDIEKAFYYAYHAHVISDRYEGEFATTLESEPSDYSREFYIDRLVVADGYRGRTNIEICASLMVSAYKKAFPNSTWQPSANQINKLSSINWAYQRYWLPSNISLETAEQYYSGYKSFVNAAVQAVEAFLAGQSVPCPDEDLPPDKPLPPGKYTLTINTRGQGTTNPSPGTHTYNQRTEVTVAAYPGSGWVFDHWTGTNNDSVNPTAVIMDSNKTVTAYFEEIPPHYSPIVACSPSSFGFTATEGASNPPNKTLSIWNSGGGTLNWSVRDDATWLTLTRTDGSTSGTDYIILLVDISGMSAGSYSATVTISASVAANTPQTVPVNLTINPPGFDPWVYDVDEDGEISKTEALTAIVDYFDGLIAKEQALEAIVLYFA